MKICITFVTPLVEQGSVIDMFRFEICITFVMKICDEICDPRDYDLYYSVVTVLTPLVEEGSKSNLGFCIGNYE